MFTNLISLISLSKRTPVWRPGPYLGKGEISCHINQEDAGSGNSVHEREPAAENVFPFIQLCIF